jgi:hypothetical protein
MPLKIQVTEFILTNSIRKNPGEKKGSQERWGDLGTLGLT